MSFPRSRIVGEVPRASELVSRMLSAVEGQAFGELADLACANAAEKRPVAGSSVWWFQLHVLHWSPLRQFPVECSCAGQFAQYLLIRCRGHFRVRLGLSTCQLIHGAR